MKKRNKGFSLIELIVFIVTLSIAFAFLSFMGRNADLENSNILLQQQLIRDARIFLEQIKVEKFSESTCNKDCLSSSSIFSKNAPYTNYLESELKGLGSNTVFEVDISNSGGLFDIPEHHAKRISVRATSLFGDKPSVTLTAFVFTTP